MNNILMFSAIVLILCIAFSKMLYKAGVPTLLIFMGLGMLLGSDGILGTKGIPFEDYELAEDICSIALVFIMFYGGFGTNWGKVKPIAVKAVLLSSLGTVLTAAFTGLFCHYVLNFSLLEGLLIGAVLGSTDAASVFSILRSRKMSLKGGVDSILEVESGSNDPFAYMLTIVVLTVMTGDGNIFVPTLLAKQIIIGSLVGALLGLASVWVLRKVSFEIDSFPIILVMAGTILGYSLCNISFIGGNGFLCVYISGIIIGNSKIFYRKSISNFFDGISWLMQIMLFFMLGLLSFPSKLPELALTGTLIALFMMLVARPAAVLAIMAPFRTPMKQQAFISWVGIRGAASIAFSIYAVTSSTSFANDIFHIVFIVVLFSVLIQGSFIPVVANKLSLINENNNNTLKSLGDMEDETYNQLLEFTVYANHKWANKKIMEANLPKDVLIVMVKRGRDVVVPNGSTVIIPGDVLILSGSNLDSIVS